jgi:hypothetical protein
MATLHPNKNEALTDFIARSIADAEIMASFDSEESCADACKMVWEAQGESVMSAEMARIKQEKLDRFYSVKSDRPDIMVKDIDLQKRTVTGIYNAYYFVDSVQDVLIPGAAAKSISDRGPKGNSVEKIKHALFHDLTKLPGKIITLVEQEVEFAGRKIFGQYFETLMSQSTDGTDTLIKYQEKIYDNHSIGFRYNNLIYLDQESKEWNMWLNLLINPEEALKCGYMFIIKEITLWEGSTVGFGANKLTPYMGVKSNDKQLVQMKIYERMDALKNQLKSGTVSDKSMQSFELQMLQLKQMISESFEVETSVKDTLIKPSEPDTKQEGTQLYDYLNQRLFTN